MKEQLTSFETAKLAKEKGFDPIPQGIYTKYYSKTDEYELLVFKKSVTSVRNDDIKVATQSLLQKWLRDQKVLVEVSPIDGWDSWSYNITREDAMSPFFIAHQCNEEYETYEHALEEGLKKALDLM